MTYSKLKAYKAGLERWYCTRAKYTWFSKRWLRMKLRTQFNLSPDIWQLLILGMFTAYVVINLMTSFVEIETRNRQFEMMNKPDVVINKYYNIPR